MCGIIYARRKDKMPIGKTVLKRYRKQRERGHEGFGFITIDAGKMSGIHRFEKEADLEEALKDCKSSNILFHHRYPTSTPNYKDLTHPIVVRNKTLEHNYYVVHNGVLQNENTLKATHEALGFKYTTLMKETFIVETLSGETRRESEQFNDSESLAIELALYFDGKKKTIDAVGTIAFVCLETDKEDNVLFIHYGRNGGNPLVVEDNNDLFFIKSVGDGAKIDEDEILTINYATGERQFKLEQVGKRFPSTPTSRYAERDDDPYDNPYAANAGVIGFGATDRDTFRRIPAQGAVLSPRQFLPERMQRRLMLGSPMDDDGDEDVARTPEQQAMVENMQLNWDDNPDWGKAYEAYKLTDEYLLELWVEIEELEKEIKKRSQDADENLFTNKNDAEINLENLDECIAVLESKKHEATKLENYLKMTSKHWK